MLEIYGVLSYNNFYKYEREVNLNRLRNEMSGVFHRHSSKLMFERVNQWNNFYLRRQEKTSSEIDLSKYLIYYLAFKDLGFFDNLKEESKIIQLGVGHGRTLKTIIENEEKIRPIGLDISIQALNFLKERSYLKNLVCADALSLPFSNNSIDRIFEVGVVEHFYESDPFEGYIVNRELVIESFRELHRILKTNGIVGFIQPSKHSVLRFSQKFDQILGRWEFGFQENFSINEFCQLISIAGFRDIHYLIIQSPKDFPKRIKVGDKLLKVYYNLTGQFRKAELTGALFCLVAKK